MAGEQLNPQTTESNVGLPYDGVGEYNPFVGENGSGSIYVPPVAENPFFVSPAYATGDYGSLKVYLAADEAAEFFEDEKSLGFFQSNKIIYAPSVNFGTKRIYKARVTGKTSLNYFVVTIDKSYKNFVDLEIANNPIQAVSKIGDQNSSLKFDYDFTNENNGRDVLTRQDLLYKENVKIIEFEFDPGTKAYQQINETNLNSNNGTINLNFRFVKEIKVDGNPLNVTDPLGDPIVNYDVTLLSNFKDELGDVLTLDYEIVSQRDDRLDKGKVKLKHGKSDKKQIRQSFISNGAVKIFIEGELPKEFTITDVYWANKQTAERHPEDYTRWRKANRNFIVPSKDLTAGIVVIVLLEKEIQVDKPSINISNDYFDVEVKESDKEKSIAIDFSTENTDYVLVYLSPKDYIKVDAGQKYVDLYFKEDFKGEYGVKRIVFVPVSEKYGTGDTKFVLVKFLSVNDYPSITQIGFPDTIEIPSFSDLQIEYDVEYNSFAATSVDVDLFLKDKSRVTLFKNLTPNGKFTINLKKLSEQFPNWNGKENVILALRPYNRGGESELIGNEYEIVTKLEFPAIDLNEDNVRKTLYDAFDKYLDKLVIAEPEKESKYLTHLANFGNDNQILISSWEEDNWTLSDKVEDDLGNFTITKEVKSLILKLYEDLPNEFDKNDTLWITRLVTNSIVETVILTKDESIECPTIKGPNFHIDVDYIKGSSTNFESLDSLLLSGSENTSAKLVETYLSSSLIDFDDLNIEYVSGSSLRDGEFIWKNFVHFSSAKERVNNFVYKLQLVENYEYLMASASTDVANIQSVLGYPSSYTASLQSQKEYELNKSKKLKIIQGFDGFERFLYESSSYTTGSIHSFTWPYINGVRVDSTNEQIITPWYTSIIESAETYDTNNNDFVLNNIPQYLFRKEENEEFLLFLSMIGHHFDNLYFYTKAIENARQLGYKDRGKLVDKLLYDNLLSFGWDAKNLSIGSKLWKYAFGLNDAGQLVESNPAKKRTYEIWRRLINNLPYLLKHKGTRRGIYALMSCYGIPASNLSIFEFGGPNIQDTLNKTKLEMENLTHVLKMSNGEAVEIDWKYTPLNRKPDTIEIFLTPAKAGNYKLISGSGWELFLSSSNKQYYGNVGFAYKEGDGTPEIFQSSLLPIFNGDQFGIKLTRQKGAGGNTLFGLNVIQSKDGINVFSNQRVYPSLGSNYDSGSFIRLGNNYTGSIDEFRLWRTILSNAAFNDHCNFPEMINGNFQNSSTEDLIFRLDFEYPKNLGATNPTRLINVAANIKYSGSLTRNDFEDNESLTDVTSSYVSASYFAYAYNFTSKPNYPYNFDVFERSVTLAVPDGITSRYMTNKVRFEEQTLVSDLSSKTRSTVKSLDNAPMDSNRIGIFFSPNKELNIDIAKSFGDLNLGNYIGSPEDLYNPEYKGLNTLRKYYFKRFKNRDIQSYLNLVAQYEQALFDDIKNMLPARVKPTTGILIEPHFLERSKIANKKPSGENEQHTAVHKPIVNVDSENLLETTLIEPKIIPTGINEYNETVLKQDIELKSENVTYGGSLNLDDDLQLKGENIMFETIITAGLYNQRQLQNADNFTTVIGMDDTSNFGFGLYVNSGSTERVYYDKKHKIIRERVLVYTVKEKKTKTITKYKVLLPDGTGDPRGGTETSSSVYYEKKLVIQPFTGSNGNKSDPPIEDGDKIKEVKIVNGYIPNVHHKFTKDATLGLDNSYFKGSKNVASKTIDKAPPVEVFATNPNTLVVNKAGRTSSEPILEVE